MYSPSLIVNRSMNTRKVCISYGCTPLQVIDRWKTPGVLVISYLDCHSYLIYTTQTACRPFLLLLLQITTSQKTTVLAVLSS
jgi:hypothetical protein